jgi:hypothetical protein
MDRSRLKLGRFLAVALITTKAAQGQDFQADWQKDHDRHSDGPDTSAKYAASRWAAAPSNWTLHASASIRPYEEISIAIAGASLEGGSFRVSSLTKIDDKEIESDSRAGHPGGQGYGDSSGLYGLQLVNAYLPVFQFPTTLGATDDGPASCG